MFQSLVVEDKFSAPRRTETTWQCDQINHLVQDHVGSIDEILFAGSTTGHLVAGLAGTTYDMAFAALDDSVAAKFATHGAR